MQAYNRPLHEWFKLIDLGQLPYPDSRDLSVDSQRSIEFIALHA